MEAIRFATIGTSGICEQFVNALKDVPASELVGCYSRSLDKARDFSLAHGASLAFDDLSALASSGEIDAVYISSPNALHAPQAIELLRAGKHVLVEKSFASNVREAEDVFAAADASGVVAMEAMRNLHVNTFERIRREVERIGKVRLANFSFSKVTSRVAKLRAGERINIFDPAMSAGALMDIGVYCVAPAIALFGEPEHVCAVGVTAEVPGCDEGDPCRLIDLSGVIALGYPDMAVSLTFGKVSDDKIACQVQGEDATLVWDQVSCPENLRVYDHEDKGMLFRLETGEGRRIDVAPHERDMTCEIQAFVDGVRGKRDLSRFREITLGTLRVMDEARRQMGVVFPADLSS